MTPAGSCWPRRASPSDGGDVIQVGGKTIERKVDGDGAFQGESYASYIVDYDATGFHDLTRFYDASGELQGRKLATQWGYYIFVQSELLQRKTVDGDGSYDISSFDIAGQTFNSDEEIFEAGGLRAAVALDNVDGSGALTLYVPGASVSVQRRR